MYKLRRNIVYPDLHRKTMESSNVVLCCNLSYRLVSQSIPIPPFLLGYFDVTGLFILFGCTRCRFYGSGDMNTACHGKKAWADCQSLTEHFQLLVSFMSTNLPDCVCYVCRYNYTNNDGLNLYAYGRCVGNAGFPTTIEKIPSKAATAELIAYDDRLYEILTQPIGPITAPTGYNGWARLTFNNDTLTLDYQSLSLDNTTGELSTSSATDLLTETFKADLKSGSVNLIDQQILDPDLTTVV